MSTGSTDTIAREAATNRPADLLRLARPYQWVKNGFVFAGLLFVGEPWSMEVVAPVLRMAAAFCLMSSGVYVFNDFVDRQADRAHPTKRLRPLASGQVSSTAAGLLLLASVVAALLLGATVSTAAVAILGAYAIINVLYTFRLKHIVILDVFVIASGFMLRILAGTAGVGIPPSHWLVLCAMMLTVFLGLGKRRAELTAGGDDLADRRQVLDDYDPAFVDAMMSVTASGAVLAFGLYTVDAETIAKHGTDTLIYTLPFVLYGVFRYLYIVHRARGGGDPAADLVRDPHVLVTVVSWAATVWWLLYG